MPRARADPVGGIRTRVDSTDTTPSGIAAAWRTGPIGILRRTPGDATPRDRST
ncbi:hypothetical protein [Streptomyces canus]|uniref:hypothetical protein n=1 Tax=Streptomyces canus TaxID=58343 RepID=UPI00386C392D